MIIVCYDEFSSKHAMETNGWTFDWNDEMLFWPKGSFCNGIPPTSYCGFRAAAADGLISYTFSASGTANLSFGTSWDDGSVHIYVNNDELGSRNTRGISNLSFDYSPGDVLQIKDNGRSVINIHSLCMSSGLFSGISLG